MALFGLTLCQGCGERSVTLHFVLPNDFKGLIKIVEDSKNGAVIPEQSGTFTYVIPTNGEIRVSSIRPFSTWHKLTAVFQNGTVLKTDTDDNVPDDVPALRSFIFSKTANSTVNAMGCFYGTVKESDKLGNIEM